MKSQCHCLLQQQQQAVKLHVLPARAWSLIEYEHITAGRKRENSMYVCTCINGGFLVLLYCCTAVLCKRSRAVLDLPAERDRCISRPDCRETAALPRCNEFKTKNYNLQILPPPFESRLTGGRSVCFVFDEKKKFNNNLLFVGTAFDLFGTLYT